MVWIGSGIGVKRLFGGDWAGNWVAFVAICSSHCDTFLLMCVWPQLKSDLQRLWDLFIDACLALWRWEEKGFKEGVSQSVEIDLCHGWLKWFFFGFFFPPQFKPPFFSHFLSLSWCVTGMTNPGCQSRVLFALAKEIPTCALARNSFTKNSFNELNQGFFEATWHKIAHWLFVLEDSLFVTIVVCLEQQARCSWCLFVGWGSVSRVWKRCKSLSFSPGLCLSFLCCNPAHPWVGAFSGLVFELQNINCD